MDVASSGVKESSKVGLLANTVCVCQMSSPTSDTRPHHPHSGVSASGIAKHCSRTLLSATGSLVCKARYRRKRACATFWSGTKETTSLCTSFGSQLDQRNAEAVDKPPSLT